MQARDVMTENVACVEANDMGERVSKLFLEHRISGAPVVDGEGHVLGVVSEGDSLRRVAGGRPRLATAQRAPSVAGGI
jgi:CBS domain-containing protein